MLFHRLLLQFNFPQTFIWMRHFMCESSACQSNHWISLPLVWIMKWSTFVVHLLLCLVVKCRCLQQESQNVLKESINVSDSRSQSTDQSATEPEQHPVIQTTFCLSFEDCQKGFPVMTIDVSTLPQRLRLRLKSWQQAVNVSFSPIFSVAFTIFSPRFLQVF